MNYVMFLDDLRSPADVNVSAHHMKVLEIARTSLEAKIMVINLGMPSFIYFDHDLGGDDTAMNFINWLIQYDMANDLIGKGFEFFVHSQNPVGAKNISAKLDNYLSWKHNLLN